MNLVDKKQTKKQQLKKVHRRKKIFTDANLRKQQKGQYIQVYLCAYVQNFTPRERCIQV